MEYDLDPFDDVLPEPVIDNVPSRGKFQPKVKPNPGKGSSASVASQLDDALHLKEMGVKSRKRKTSSVSDHAQKSKQSSATNVKEKVEKSTMRLRKCSARQLIDESDEEAPGISDVVDVEDGNDECREANKETDQPPKKFSRSTRRRARRQVDRTLLETPEEELELTNMPMKDLIMFYLHKERMEDKETKSKKPMTNSSTHNEEEIFGAERSSDFADNQGGDAVEMTNPYFNYQSYMDKTQRVKWSKQDDELFYKSIQQFGIDLSMIQLLFPDRTRRQIKLKLKKEERQHPLRLTQAVQNRAKDYSQYELIIEQLKKSEAEKEFMEVSLLVWLVKKMWMISLLRTMMKQVNLRMKKRQQK